MAVVISELWKRDDKSLLIMPGTLPIDSAPVLSELTKYLEEGWDPVIKTDVDGANALPLRIDQENKHFGRTASSCRGPRTGSTTRSTRWPRPSTPLRCGSSPKRAVSHACHGVSRPARRREPYPV